MAERYCALLGFGYARLTSAPKEALDFAEAASALYPEQPEPTVLAGRARLRMGEWEPAFAALSAAVGAKSRPLGDVAALREFGILAQLTSHLTAAAEAYRSLVPRVAFTEDPTLIRVSVIEAAAVLALNGAAGLADASLYLTDARRQPPVPGLDDLATAFLALCLDRAGSSDQAQVLIRATDLGWGLERFLTRRERARLGNGPEAAGAGTLPVEFFERAPVLVDGELHAAIAYAAFGRDPRLARAHLQAYLQTPGGKGPFKAWAEHLLATLPRSGPR